MKRSPHRPVFDPEIIHGRIDTGAQPPAIFSVNPSPSTLTRPITVLPPTIPGLPTTVTITASVLAPTSITAFDPLAVGWNHAWWVEGPEFVAQGYSDGASVGTWPDEIGSADLTQSTSGRKPIYRSSGTGFSLPAVDFDGTDDVLGPVSFTSFSTPHSVVAIVYTDVDVPSSTADYIFDGFDATHRLACGIRETTGEWRHFSGSLASGGSATIAKHAVFSFVSSTTADHLYVDGTDITGDCGNQAMTGITMGGSYTGDANWDGRIVWLSTYDGNVSSDSDWSGFVGWASSKYGVTF